MSKITEILGQNQETPATGLSELQRTLLEYMNSHTDEVFSYNEAREVAYKLGQPDADVIRWALWTLESRGLIAKTRVAQRLFFGSRTAIAQLIASRRSS